MGNNISIDSYLNPNTCWGRNITWAHLKYNGTLPSPYSECPNAARVLKSHCCEDGICRPSSIDHEFDRYHWYEWNGLGWPYEKGDGKVVVGGKKNGKACKPPFIKRGLMMSGDLGMVMDDERELGKGMGSGDFKMGLGGYEYPYQESIAAPRDMSNEGAVVGAAIGIMIGGALLSVLALVISGRMAKKERKRCQNR